MLRAVASGGMAPLVASDANTIEQRNGTTAQSFRVYNTYTDASNYERGVFQWASNFLEVGTEAAGTGSTRSIRFKTGGTNRWEMTNTQFAQSASGNMVLATYMRSQTTTVASLGTPAGLGNGTRAHVTDATLAFTSANIGSALVGGGANHTPCVVVNGAWVIG